MILSAQNTEILKWLARYKYLCTAQVHQHFFEGKTLRNTQMTLQKLADLDLIKAEKLPLIQGLNLGSVCYLTKAGFEVVEQDLHVHNQELRYKAVSKPISSINHYYHRKRLVDFMISLDLELSKWPRLFLKTIKTEARQAVVNGKRTFETKIEKGETALVPDLSFVLKNNTTGHEAAYFVEIDTGKETIGGQFNTIPDGSLLDKFLKYEEFIGSKDWKTNLHTSATDFQVLTITEKEGSMKTLAERAGARLQYTELFLFSTYDILERDSFLDAPVWWDGKGYAPLI